MSFYGVLKSLYHGVVPVSVRDLAYRATPGPLRRLRLRLLNKMEKSAQHDEIYTADYYERVIEPAMQMSVQAIAASIVEHFHPANVVDVGCGSGLLLLTLRQKGVDGIGFEYSAAACDMCRARGLEVRRFDIEHDTAPEARADVVISTEVAEHLPASCADRFVDLLCSFSDNIVLTAAVPGVEGTDHVNEQPNEYWIQKFEARGLDYDKPRSLAWRERWHKAGAAGCFANTLMLFKRSQGARTEPLATADKAIPTLNAEGSGQ
jgi:SAM-dependent methyltransferase